MDYGRWSFSSKMAGWSEEETSVLISIWGAANVQQQLDSVTRNRHIYEKIANDMAEHGYHKTWQQCKTKIKNLRQYTTPHIISRDPISFGFLVYIDAVCRL